YSPNPLRRYEQSVDYLLDVPWPQRYGKLLSLYYTTLELFRPFIGPFIRNREKAKTTLGVKSIIVGNKSIRLMTPMILRDHTQYNDEKISPPS
ncbi:hypothetical protein AKJ41_03980, partial [candidate division MSBL1 archaeon SCGC-AAA259O05]